MTYEDVEYCYFLANSVFDHDEHVAVSKFEIYTRTHTFSGLYILHLFEHLF